VWDTSGKKSIAGKSVKYIIALASVHYKGLAETLSSLESALTKNMGGGGVMVNQPSDKDGSTRIRIRILMFF